MADGAVVLAYVHQNNVHYSWHQSMVQFMAYDVAVNQRVARGGQIAIRCGTGSLPEARNDAVRMFLADRKADWMLWVDTDMGFLPDTVDRLIDAADPVERPIVGGLCFSQHEDDPDGMGGHRWTATPTVYDWTSLEDGQMGWSVRWDFEPNTLIRVGGTGSACILIHRSVFERIEEANGRVWYDRVFNTTTGQLISEDLSFCLRAGALDIPMWVHTGVETTHAKQTWLSADDYWQQRAVRNLQKNLAPSAGSVEEGAWDTPRYAVIPTHNRPARLLSLVVSLGTQVDTIVVLDNASTPPVDVEKLQASVPDRVTVEVIRDEEQPPNLARFWNVMFDRCAELAKDAGQDEWDVAVLNDDSAVPAGWYKACAGGLRRHGTAVIAHTTPTTPALLTELHNDPNNRMTPHAFVIRGDLGLRADESMRWWYQDSDLDWRARLAGGVLSVDGPRVVNVLANTTTTGPLAEQAAKDHAAFEAKWSK